VINGPPFPRLSGTLSIERFCPLISVLKITPCFRRCHYERRSFSVAAKQRLPIVDGLP
jgi:hypothetical protein